MQKFNVGDIVGTNLQYIQGFDDYTVPPQDLKRLRNLKVTRVDQVEQSDFIYVQGERLRNWGEPFIYTCQSKTKTYQINQCFLEEN